MAKFGKVKKHPELSAAWEQWVARRWSLTECNGARKEGAWSTSVNQTSFPPMVQTTEPQPRQGTGVLLANTTQPPGVAVHSTKDDLLLNMWEVAPLSMMRQMVPSALMLRCHVVPSGVARAQPKLASRCGARRVADAANNE